MPDAVITVQGRSTRRVPAELGTAHFSVRGDGVTRGPVMAEVTASAESLKDLVSGHGSSVTSTSSDTVRIWTERPWSADGRLTEPVFHVQIDRTVEMDDFDALSRLIDTAAALPGVSVQSLEWSLAEQSRAAIVAEVRHAAVADAVAKATAYAEAIGRSDVTATAVADAGMLDGAAPAGGGVPIGVMRSAMAASSESGSISLAPQPIEVEAVVDARFTAR